MQPLSFWNMLPYLPFLPVIAPFIVPLVVLV